jgi:phosphoglycerate dehydrogenase-like enzyme
MMLLLAMAKRLPLINGLVTTDRLAQAGYPIRPYDKRHTAGANFGRIPNLQTIAGMRLGLLGLGEIGYDVAPMANAFGMQVSYHKRSRLSNAMESSLKVQYQSLEDLFAKNDFVSIHIPLNEETTGLVNRDLIDRMPNGAFLINTSRAQIVNEADLLAALSIGKLGGVGLDVMRQEPAAEDDPLLAFPEVIITPHLGGASRMNGLNDARDMLGRMQEYLMN